MRRARFGGVLLRKLFRDLFARKMMISVIVLIMTVGVGFLITMTSVYRDLDGARANYYRDYRLADFSIAMKRAPESAVQSAKRIFNVSAVRGRISIPTLLELPGVSEPITGLALSLPGERRPILNDVLLRTGVWFSGPNKKEAILNEAFAAANGLRPGDRIKVMLLDQQHDVLVIGTAMSPEFVYMLPPDGGIAPDPARFGVIYMSEDFLQASSDQEGAYNELIGKVFDASPSALDRTLVLLEKELDPWGVPFTTPVQDQPSVRFLRDELTGLRVSSSIMPGIFLGVALLILNVLMNRLVMQQRVIVGTLKALGRSTSSIIRHYLGFGMVIGLLGAIAGSCMALVLQPLYVDLYSIYYALPFLEPHFYPDLHGLGVLVSIAFAALGTINGTLRAARLRPAEAMRPPPPEKGGRVWIENFSLLWGKLSFRWRLVTRAIFRNPFRSSVSIITTIVATALMVTSFMMVDALEYLMDYQFNALMHQDVTVALREPRGFRGPSELRSISGLSQVEPQLTIVCDFVNGARKKRIAVTGLPKQSRLFTPLDAKGQPIRIPSRGLVMTDKLARILDVEVGDTLTLRPLIGRREKVQAPIMAIVESYLGLSAYADIDYLSGLIGEDWVANALLGTTFGDEGWDRMYKELKRRPTIVGISKRERALDQMQSTFGENMGIMLGITVFFSGLIGFGSILNTALVSLSEREREVGTFRVLGYSPGEVAAILRGELVILSLIGIALGLAAGIGLSYLISTAYDTELYRFPVVIKGHRLLEAAVCMGAFMVCAQLIVRRYIGRFDWLTAVKVSE